MTPPPATEAPSKDGLAAFLAELGHAPLVRVIQETRGLDRTKAEAIVKELARP